MGKTKKIEHRMKNEIWVKPEIAYSTWVKLNDYAKSHDMDFPTAADTAVNLIIELNL